MAVVDFGLKPLEVHKPFFASSAKERVLFGAFGSGKTYALVDEAIALLLEQPGIRGVLARKTIPQLRDSLEPVFAERMPDELWQRCEKRRHGGHYSEILFPNGSVLLFKSIDDWNKWRSLNIGFLLIDEGNEISEDDYQGVISRVRQRDLTKEARDLGYTHKITRRSIAMATNPAGHDWMWSRFVNPATRKPDTEYFTSTILDNPYLSVDYVTSLFKSYPRQWIRRYLMCEFDDFAGQIFQDWDYNRHVVRADTVKLDSRSVIWMGMDPGTESPTAGLWVAVDRPNQTLIGVSEYMEPGLNVEAHAKAWRKIEAGHNGARTQWRVSDPGSINIRDRGSNVRLSDQYRRLGFTFALGPKAYDDRITSLGMLISQGRFKLTDNCPLTYEQILGYRWEELSPAAKMKGLNAPEKPRKANDHLVDCAQYLASRFIVNHKPEKPLPPETFSEEVHRQIRENIREKQLGASSNDFCIV